MAETKRIWNQTVAGDKDLADKLVEQAAMPNSSIVEINVVGEDGRVIVSSVPSRDGQPAPQRESLAALEAFQIVINSRSLKSSSGKRIVTASRR